ncbi:MAG: hypothetical protein R3200_17460 [Xanthomonadales bacterium]|nr:hypothetical protein [Xanthomonadales bacterium]
MKSLTGLFLFLTFSAAAEDVPFDDARWHLEADSAEIVEHLGKTALYLENGRAWLPDVKLTNGTIEFDVAFGPERGFSGAMFRFQRPGDFENFYLRPHQSGKPDASQYTPEYNGVSGWQLYHGPAYAAPFKFRYNQWMRVRIEFSGHRAVVKLDGETLAIPKLKRAVQAGAVGLRSGFAPAWFADFSYSDEVPEDFASRTFEPIPENETAGLVREWRVSEAFEVGRQPDLVLESDLRDALAWKSFMVEPEGLVNLAKAAGVDRDHRAVLAEFTIESESAETRLMTFGYSDAARVFLNGAEVYRGDNGYRTRDYRYLGTIGLFDAVPLRLKSGENVVTFAIAEGFGGWGVMAAVD